MAYAHGFIIRNTNAVNKQPTEVDGDIPESTNKKELDVTTADKICKDINNKKYPFADLIGEMDLDVYQIIRKLTKEASTKLHNQKENYDEALTQHELPQMQWCERCRLVAWFTVWDGVEDADHLELSLIVNTKDLGIASGQSPTTPEPMLEPELIREPEPTLEPESRPGTRAEKPLEPLALEATSTEQNPNGASSEPELDPELLEALGESTSDTPEFGERIHES
ncbi:unnamed protein product [Parnassius apollo]|uniref:(apollo) hypothetical protein n=1 Tax=Parnassius apollo TaxID=110799 RepID=A0A8S3XAC6_PARAO|nr:unnamed protein product [Parnassius apollo]